MTTLSITPSPLPSFFCEIIIIEIIIIHIKRLVCSVWAVCHINVDSLSTRHRPSCHKRFHCCSYWAHCSDTSGRAVATIPTLMATACCCYLSKRIFMVKRCGNSHVTMNHHHRRLTPLWRQEHEMKWATIVTVTDGDGCLVFSVLQN